MHRFMSPRASIAADRTVAFWLLFCCVATLAMLPLGAITRLSDSGLSIAEWRPLLGWIPPLSMAEWERVFALYQNTSQYHLANFGMDLSEFKEIFWWEYLHRVWGRVIGIAFAAPFLWFLIKRRLPPGYGPRLWIVLALGASQGGIGWWMVSSGFVGRTEVSPYRLATHLGIALAFLGYLWWLTIPLIWPDKAVAAPRWLRRFAALTCASIVVTALVGALTAGLNAGLLYNDWPLMNGAFIPEGYLSGPLSLFESAATVQFNHRMVAYLTVALVIGLWLAMRRARMAPRLQQAAGALVILALAQMILGIITVSLAVPLVPAMLHQVGAALCLLLGIWIVRGMRGTR